MEPARLEPAPAPGAAVATLPPPAKKGIPRGFVIVVAVAAAVAIAIGVHAGLTAGEVDTDNAQVESDVVPLAARVSGQVVRVLVRDDQLVKKGDVLVELDPADFEAKVAQATAELEFAEAQAAAAEAQAKVAEASARGGFSSAQALVSGTSMGVGSAQAQIEAARAAVVRAETDKKRTEIDLSRAKELRAANAVTQERLDNAQLAADSTAAALEAAKAQLTAAGEGKRVAESNVEQAKGRLSQSAPIAFQIAVARANADGARARAKSATALLDLAMLQLSYTKVRAPSDGFVSRLSARDGQILAPSMPIAELVPDTTYVVANFKETQVGSMRAGDRVEVSVDAYPGRRFEGKVLSLSGGTGARFSLLPPDNASGNFVKVVQRVPVRIGWAAPPDAAMRAGLSAEVTVHLASR